jgi:hypothetical protein
MPFKHQCLLYVIRYMPNAANGLFDNVAILLLDQSTGKADYRVTDDFDHVEFLDPDFDPNLITQLESAIRSRIEDPIALSHFLQNGAEWPSNALSAVLQSGVETNDFPAEMEIQAEMLLTRAQRSENIEKAPRLRSATREIHKRVIEQFKSFGVWNLMLKGIQTHQYVPASRIRIDCGYIASGGSNEREFKMIHALDIDAEPDRALELAEVYPDFSKSLQDEIKARPTLTVISRDWVGLHSPQGNTPYATLELVGINTARVVDLPMLASTARQDFGMRNM